MSRRPIADYAMLSDSHSAALVSRDGSIDWLCMPRFDSPSVFGRLLDDDAGHWSIRPAGRAAAGRRYLERSLVLETTFRAPTGSAVLTDAMPVGSNVRGHELGAEAPHALLRRVACTGGEVEVEVEYAPRPEYGLVYPLLRPADGGGVVGRGGPVVLLLSATVEVAVEESVARARFVLREGESAAFALQFRSSLEPAPRHWDAEEIERRVDDTARAWRSWSDLHQNYDGPWSDLVAQSGRVLQGLTFFPTGALVAAPTTSLPEVVGGERNWDYRYTWVRDASLTLDALWVAACPDEAYRFFDFIAAAALTQLRRGGDLQIMFGIAGEHDLTERELPHLRGWRGSRPVRIGNGAWNQRQLDAYGALLAAAHRLRDYLADLDPVTRGFLAEVADAAADRWTRPGHGIWEVRAAPRHYLHGKLLCWVALDRAIALADLLGARDRVPRWAATRDEIRRAILERGWNPRVGAFTQTLDGAALDAANLTMPIVGFLPATDPRMRATIDAISRRLSDTHGLVYRYRAEDGMPGAEGAFLLCTFWLAEAQALAGEVGRARETFERAAAFANDLGLLSEEVDPESGELLGNFPQAFSHIGLVNAAWAITQASRTGGER